VEELPTSFPSVPPLNIEMESAQLLGLKEADKEELLSRRARVELQHQPSKQKEAPTELPSR